MIRLLLLILLFLNTAQVYAEWVKIGASDNATVYADQSTIHRNRNLVKMWQLNDYETVQVVGGIRFLTAEQEWEFDCEKERSRMIALKKYSDNMGSGTEVYRNSAVGKWQPVAPESAAQALWKLACDK